MHRNLEPLDGRSANINVCIFLCGKPTGLVEIWVTRKWTLRLTDTLGNAKCLGTMNVSRGHQDETLVSHGARLFRLKCGWKPCAQAVDLDVGFVGSRKSIKSAYKMLVKGAPASGPGPPGFGGYGRSAAPRCGRGRPRSCAPRKAIGGEAASGSHPPCSATAPKK